ncbi:hypothetical protein cyc_04314 [Cyclospora cayetanensis]|uniref:Uncharacterized protein n=1 Tax=Cyclospora cayetanensis TaxID=88456 RepID=A0A1D3D746_9EIME|nr:hypothetical protein cyc_04314 [Cyclospora cayetanensis]
MPVPLTLGTDKRRVFKGVFCAIFLESSTQTPPSHCGAPGIPGDDGSVDLASADFHPPHALAMAELTGAFVIPEEAILGGAHRKLPDEQACMSTTTTDFQERSVSLWLQDRLPEDVASQAMEGSAVCERPFPEVGSVCTLGGPPFCTNARATARHRGPLPDPLRARRLFLSQNKHAFRVSASPSGASSSPPARQRKREPRSESLSGDSPAPTRRGPQHPSSGVGGASGAPQASLAEARLKAAAGAAASSSRRLRAQERGPQGPLGEAHETNRRVRFWWLRTAQSQSSAAETPHTLPNTPGGPFFPPPLGGPSAAPFFGMNNKCQRLPGSRAALLPKPARISSAVPCSSRKAGAVLERASSERGTGRVTCAYAASRKPPLARRACSTCIRFPRALQLSLPAPLATIPLEGGAALEAAEGAASDSSPSVGATVPQHDATGDVSLQGDPRRSSCVSLNSLSRGSGGAFANRSPLVHPQLSGERERPFLHAREGPPRKDPLACRFCGWTPEGAANAGSATVTPPASRAPARSAGQTLYAAAATAASAASTGAERAVDTSGSNNSEPPRRLTPGRHAETRQAVDAAAAAGVRGVDLFASNRVTSSCTCGTAAVGAMPLCPVVAALPVHEQSGLLPREVRPQKSSSKGEDGAADCVHCESGAPDDAAKYTPLGSCRACISRQRMSYGRLESRLHGKQQHLFSGGSSQSFPSAARVLCCYSSAASPLSSVSNTGGKRAGGSAELCRSLHAGSCTRAQLVGPSPPLQQQPLMREEDAGVAPASAPTHDSSDERALRNCGWVYCGSVPPAVKLPILGEWGGLRQRRVRKRVAARPSQLMTDTPGRFCSSSTDLEAFPDSQRMRLGLAARIRMDPSLNLPLSSHTDDGRVLRSSRRSKEALTDKGYPERKAEKFTGPTCAEAIDARQSCAAAGAASAGSCTGGNKEAREALEAQPLSELFAQKFERLPSSPGESCSCKSVRSSSPLSPASPSLTMDGLSPRQGSAEFVELPDNTPDVGETAGDARLPPTPWDGRLTASVESFPASVSGGIFFSDSHSIWRARTHKTPASTSPSCSELPPALHDEALAGGTAVSHVPAPAATVLALPRDDRDPPSTRPCGGRGEPRNHRKSATQGLLQRLLLDVPLGPGGEQDEEAPPQQARHPQSCPDLQGLQGPPGSTKRLLEELMQKVPWTSRGREGCLCNKTRAGTLLTLGCSKATSCLIPRSSLNLTLPGRGGQPLFTEEPLQCSSPPDEATIPRCTSSPAAARGFRRPCAPSASSSTRGVLRGGVPLKAWEEEPKGGQQEVAGTERGLLDEQAHRGVAFEGQPKCRGLSALLQGGAEVPEQTDPHATEATSGKATAETGVPSNRGDASLLAEGGNPHGLDWCNSGVIAGLSTRAAKLLGQTPSCQAAVTSRAALLEALQKYPGDCPEATRKAAEFLAEIAVLPSDESRGAPSRRLECTEPTAPPDPAQIATLFDFLGADVEHCLREGPSQVLGAALAAQDALALEYQSLLDKLPSVESPEGLSHDMPSTTVHSTSEIYAQALKKACHSALQRALKASRATAALQLADEERIRLLCRYEEQMQRPLRTEAETPHCSLLSHDADTPPQRDPPQPLYKRSQGLLQSSSSHHGGRAYTTHGKRDDACRIRDRVASPSCLENATQEAAALKASRRSRLSGETHQKSNEAEGPQATFSQLQLTGDAVEDFEANLQLVSAFLNEFSTWEFRSPTGGDPEKRFLEELQQEFASITQGGAEVSLQTFLSQQRHAALQSLPKDRSSPEQIRALLQTVAQQAAARLPPVETLLQKQVTTRVDLLLRQPPRNVDNAGPCENSQVGSWSEDAKNSPSSNTCEAKPSVHLGHSWSSPAERSVSPESAVIPTLEKLEALVDAKLEELKKSCADYLREAAQTLEDVMQVNVVRLPQ